MPEVHGPDILKHVEECGFHPRPRGVRGTPKGAFRAEERDEKDQADGSDEHGGGHAKKVAVGRGSGSDIVFKAEYVGTSH